MQSKSDRQEGQDFAVLLFMLPNDEAESQRIQDRFLSDREFWARWIPNLKAWTQPICATRTETPDGKSALALILTTSPMDTLFEEIGHNIAEALEVPAYTCLYTNLDPTEIAEMKEAPKPW